YTVASPSALCPLALHDALPIFGLSLGEGWQAGRDKICVGSTPGGFGLWAEQLLAESTGKLGKGLVPAPGEAAAGNDRQAQEVREDRKITRLNSSHEWISYAVFC